MGGRSPTVNSVLEIVSPMRSLYLVGSTKGRKFARIAYRQNIACLILAKGPAMHRPAIGRGDFCPALAGHYHFCHRYQQSAIADILSRAGQTFAIASHQLAVLASASRSTDGGAPPSRPTFTGIYEQPSQPSFLLGLANHRVPVRLLQASANRTVPVIDNADHADNRTGLNSHPVCFII